MTPLAQFLSIILLLLPHYVSIMIGFLAGKFFKIDKDTIASLLVNIIVPIVIFNSVASTRLTLGVLSLPVLFFLIGSLISVSMYFLGKIIWKDNTKNIFAFTTGTGNLGYFGLPVGIALLGSESAGIIMLCAIGLMFYENTVGYFFVAKSHYSVKDSLIKVAKLPILHGFILGIIASLFSVQFGNVYLGAAANFRGAFSILGMMMIGLALSDIKKFTFDKTFIASCLAVKYILWPVVMGIILYIDWMFFRIYVHDTLTRNSMVILSVMPQTTSTVIFATLLNVQPQKAATAVAASFILALFVIPIVFMML